jgi:hypothetical protein
LDRVGKRLNESEKMVEVGESRKEGSKDGIESGRAWGREGG